MMDSSAVPVGLYRHFKGGLYRVIGTAVDARSADLYVLYKSVDLFPGPESKKTVLWARDHRDFSGMVHLPDGESVPRFVLQEETPG